MPPCPSLRTARVCDFAITACGPRGCFRALALALLLAWNAPAALAQGEPEFRYEAYCDALGRFTSDQASQALVQRPAHLRRVYEDAARGDSRAKELIRELEQVFRDFGTWVAEETTQPKCLPLPEVTPGCLPRLGFLDELLGHSPEAARLREVVAQAYEIRARERGAQNAVVVAVINLLVARGLAQDVVGKAAATESQQLLDSRGLGTNPFRGKTPQEIDQMFREKGFQPRGPAPVTGKGGYVDPKTGRSYHIDPGGQYKKGTELPHVDVNRPAGSNLPKRKYPLGDKLNTHE